MEIKGKYNTAIVYQSKIDDTTEEQIKTLLDQPFVEGETIRIMPDCHAGKGCVIGFTTTINNNKVCPNLVGVDIGCGMLAMKLEGIRKEDVDLKAFDEFIYQNIPSGFNINDQPKAKCLKLGELRCLGHLKNIETFQNALGSLGGGNHFIEIDEDDEGSLWFVVHTGSRNLGKQVADWYQSLADSACNEKAIKFDIERKFIIESYKLEHREYEIQNALTKLKQKYKDFINEIPTGLSYLEGQNLDDYLFDMDICQQYASINRATICRQVAKWFGLDYNAVDSFETVHNYIDLGQKILRKGAIDCSYSKKVLIPLNMRDGSLICIGQSNKEYNCSGPHGAGRLMSRIAAKESIEIDQFKKSMEGIYTSCVSEATKDESPFAYKDMQDIIPWVEPTAHIMKRIKPIYNFKAGE